MLYVSNLYYLSEFSNLEIYKGPVAGNRNTTCSQCYQSRIVKTKQAWEISAARKVPNKRKKKLFFYGGYLLRMKNNKIK